MILLVLPVISIFMVVGDDVDRLALALFVLCLAPVMLLLHPAHIHIQFFLVANAFLIIMPFVVQSSRGEVMFFIGFAPLPLAPITFAAYLAMTWLTVLVYIATLKTGRARTRVPVDTSVLHPISALIGFGLIFGAFYFGLNQRWILSPRNDLHLDEVEVSGLNMMLSFAIKSMPAFIAFYLARDRVRRGRRPFRDIYYLMALASLLVICNPINTARFVSLAALGIALFPMLLARGSVSRLIFLFPVLAMLILPVTSRLRGGVDNLQTLAAVKIIESAEFSAMIVLNEILSTAVDRMESAGAYVATGIFILVPRSIWPAKSTGTGVEGAELLGYIFTNVGVPPVFDFYLDFGWIGIVMCAVLFGIIFSRGYRSLGQCSVFTAMSFMVVPIMLRGDLSTAMISVYALTFAAVVARFMLRIAWGRPQAAAF